MATITIGVASTVFTGSKPFTISDSDVTRLINWAIKAYATAPTAQVPNPPALTPAQALVAWASGLIEGTKANVVNSEQVTAALALAAPTPIVTA